MGEVVLNFSLGPSKAIFCYIKSLRHFTVNITKTLLAEFREVSSGRILEKGRDLLIYYLLKQINEYCL